MEPLTKEEQALAERLKEFRLSRGFTQREMADILGIQQGTYSSVERGRNRVSMKLMRKLVEHAGLSKQWLKTGEGEMTVGEPLPSYMAPGDRREDSEMARTNKALREKINAQDNTIKLLQQSKGRLEQTVDTLRDVIADMQNKD